MLRANQAVRLGLRAASRNAELSFAKALINQGGNLIALLPIALAAALIAALARGDALRSALLAGRALAALRWPVLGGIAAALSIALAASLLFWAGAVPLLAADAELNRRPPPGNFALLVSRGAARTLVAGILGWGISILFTLACDAAVIFAIPAVLLRPSPALFAAAALAGWLEVGRMGAFAALAADAEGLIAPEAPPEPPPRAELVVEALPADEP